MDKRTSPINNGWDLFQLFIEFRTKKNPFYTFFTSEVPKKSIPSKGLRIGNHVLNLVVNWQPSSKLLATMGLRGHNKKLYGLGILWFLLLKEVRGLVFSFLRTNGGWSEIRCLKFIFGKSGLLGFRKVLFYRKTFFEWI